MTMNVGTFVALQIEIQDRIRRAAETLRRMPREDERRHLSAGERCSWPGYVRDWHAYGADKARARLSPPSAREITEMEEVVGWISWLASRHEWEAKAMWFAFGCRAKTGDLKRTWNVSRETIRRWKKQGTEHLVAQFGKSIDCHNLTQSGKSGWMCSEIPQL